MKKITAILLSIVTLLTFSACTNRVGLENYVSELRSDVYFGQSETFTVKGGYGFNESPLSNDAKVGDKTHILTLKLMDKETSQATYTASINFNQEKYTANFKLNPVTHSLVAILEIENFNLKEFSVDITCGDKTECVTLKSLVPEGTITYVQALDYLKQSQPELIKAFSDQDGNFTAEIYARIIVKNDKAYWYVGLAGGGDLLKALLIDGKTGEVLAIREII